MHEISVFLTLTYSDENLPEGNSLVKSHFQSFMKRLRKRHGKPIRFFHCGEYGETTARPHYHAIIFGIDFADKKLYSTNHQGDKLYSSEILDEIWGKGKCWIGSVTPESTAYVARYIMKKVTGELAQEHYETVNLSTGEIYARTPEYITMSNRPGIGYEWFKKYKSDLFPSDTVITRGKESLPPAYYLKKYAELNQKGADKIKARRVRRAKKCSADSTTERLRTRLECKKSKLSIFKKRDVNE